jgi:hypothetical protein
MGNNGSFGLQVEVERVAMPDGCGPKALASRNGKVVEAYSFGVGQSSSLL